MPTTEVRVRRASRNDVDAIWRVHISAIRESCSSQYSPDEIAAWTSRITPESYDRVMRSKAVYVAQEEDEIVGFGQVDAVTGEIESVYVRPEAAGEGIGTLLLNTLEEVARECGVKRLYLDSSLNAVGFYEHAGYEVKGETHHALGTHTALACVRMEKQIKS